jgi:hypothetical protein
MIRLPRSLPSGLQPFVASLRLAIYKHSASPKFLEYSCPGGLAAQNFIKITIDKIENYWVFIKKTLCNHSKYIGNFNDNLKYICNLKYGGGKI